MNKSGLDSVLKTCLKDAANIKMYLKWLSIRQHVQQLKANGFPSSPLLARCSACPQTVQYNVLFLSADKYTSF